MTGDAGFFSFERNFDPTDQKVTYVLKVVFEGTGSTTATLNGTALDGTSYAVCKTTQFNFKPSSNMTTVVVEPQATQVAVPTKTAEEIQQDAEKDNSVNTWWTPGGFFPPWVKFYSKISNSFLNLLAKCWVGFPWGTGIDNGVGLENILLKYYESVPIDTVDVYKSMLINTITATTAIVVGAAITTIATRYMPWYWVALIVYSLALLTAIVATYCMADSNAARSILIGVGWALIGLFLGVLCSEWIVNWCRGMLTARLTGNPTAVAATKGTINFFMGYSLKSLIMTGLAISTLDAGFLIVSACLGALAVGLGISK